MSALNPTRRYPRRYNPGHFLKLTRRFSMRFDRPRHLAARIVFSGILGNKHIQRAVRAISGHGLFPIFVATAITITGHSAMLIRSIALIICAIWLSVDVAIYVSDRTWNLYWKSIFLSLVTTLACCASMGIMYWFLSSTLEDQRIDAERNLLSGVSLPPSGRWQDSVFTLSNNSGVKISAHQISCGLNLLVFGNRYNRNTIGSGSAVDFPVSNFPIDPGGDTESEECFSHFIQLDGGMARNFEPICIDTSIVFRYALENQPGTFDAKQFRYIFDDAKDSVWHRQPVEMPTSPCQKYVNAP